jgi:hypothetical protein
MFHIEVLAIVAGQQAESDTWLLVETSSLDSQVVR